MSNETGGQTSQQYWDDLAPTFDEEPDHGLRDPVVLQKWTEFRGYPSRFLEERFWTVAQVQSIGAGLDIRLWDRLSQDLCRTG